MKNIDDFIIDFITESEEDNFKTMLDQKTKRTIKLKPNYIPKGKGSTETDDIRKMQARAYPGMNRNVAKKIVNKAYGETGFKPGPVKKS
jgi:hypothetical protein